MTGFGSFFTQLARDLWSQKLRTFLTTFGIIWGTVAVGLLLAFGKGLHVQQTRSFAGLGDRIVIAWPSRTSLPFEGLGKGRRIRLDESDIEYLKQQIQTMRGISSEYSRDLQVHHGTVTRSVDVSGVSPVFGDMRNLIPATGGRFINPVDMEERRRAAFVGNRLALDLFGEEDPVGREIMIHGSPFLIVGILVAKEQDSSYSGRDHSKIFIPSSTFKALTGARYMNLFIYRAQRPELNEALTAEITTALAARKRFDPADTQAVQVWDTTEMFAFFDAFMLGFNIFLGLMGILTLVVGGIGVSNIMNVVVEERTREIGIKMALGARSWAILSQFMLETFVLTGVGGALGLGISYAICAAFPSLGLGEYVGDPELSPRLALLTAALLGAVGFLAGYFPARDAARLDPVVAMKV
ncbi:MAG: ABC transporter permease [Thermoanaerobaculales bacterium]|nr:ABC transporter permease [Thermoanaerobaculales bacterium]